jgi:hypothetical protein
MTEKTLRLRRSQLTAELRMRPMTKAQCAYYTPPRALIGFITLVCLGPRNGILKISHYINLGSHVDQSRSFADSLVTFSTMPIG